MEAEDFAKQYYALFARHSLLGVERVDGLFIKFLLKSQALVISLDGADDLRDLIHRSLQIKLTEFLGGECAVTRVVVREARVPPDAGVDAGRQVQPVLVRSRLQLRPVTVDQIGWEIRVWAVSDSPACASILSWMGGRPGTLRLG